MKLRRLLTILVVSGALASAAPAGAQTNGGEYLNRAKALLDRVPAQGNEARLVSVDDKDKRESAAEKIGDLRKHFEELVATYQASSRASGHENDWKMKFSAVERDLARIIGGGARYPSVTARGSIESAANSARPAAVGTAGTAAASSRGATPAVPSPDGAAPVESRPPQSPVPPSSTQGAVVAGSPGTSGAPAPVDSPADAGVTARGVEPTAPGVVGVGEPAQAGAAAVVPAPGTAAAAGADANPGTQGVMTVAPAGATGTAGADQAGIEGVASVSMIGIAELDPAVRGQLEKFRVELELFYTAPVK